jgi:SAM-dependent methyltransferase
MIALKLEDGHKKQIPGDCMKKYEPVMSFDERLAEEYDALAVRGDEAATIAFLERLAQGGPALELAIGTGRIAVPLSERGIRVDGIDISPAMVAKLQAKPGADKIAVTIGNFADVAVSNTYRLIFVVFNTLFNLLTQDEQVRCFQNVAAHLTEDGSFVVEALTPNFLFRLQENQYVQTEAVEVDQVRLDLLRHDAASQTIEESHVTLSSSGIHLNPIAQRYAWPSELDLMARLAGLRLKERWGTWSREPFTGASTNCVSVYGR